MAKAKEELQQNINSFWEWFLKIEPQLSNIIQNDTQSDQSKLINEIDNEVLKFGKIGWEIGHGQQKPFYLSLSPNGDKELLQICEEIILKAPSLDTWEYRAGKVIQDWDLTFMVYDESFDEHKVNATGWHQVLSLLPNRQLEITIEAPSVSHLDKATQLKSADMVVTSLVGEAKRIRLVSKINVVEEIEKHFQIRKAPIKIIAKQIDAFYEV